MSEEIPVNIDTAAKEVGRNREFIRDFVKEHGLGIPWGGSQEHPRLRVKLSLLRQALESLRYVRTGSGSRTVTLHRGVRC